MDEHRRIVEAIAACNPAGARTDMINVIGHNREFVLGMYAHVSTNATQEGISTE